MSEPIWLINARRDAGVAEIPGPANNPRIIEMFTHTSYHAQSEEAWCAAGVCTWLEECGLPSPHRADAKSFIGYGTELDTPREGCICVILAKHKDSDKAMTTSGYHVGLWLGEDTEKFYLWGANQSNTVRKSGFFKRSFDVVYMGWPEEIK